MTEQLLFLFDLTGTIAFAISGALTGVRKKMDVFGIIFLAVTTACGGGLLRDLVLGDVPPRMFRNPFFVTVAALVGAAVFVLAYCHRHMPVRFTQLYERTLFWFDTLGLAAFTVDGVMIGVEDGFARSAFLLVFVGFLTGVGGGVLRDVLSDQIPDIFIKHIYALAAIAGGLCLVLTYRLGASWHLAMIAGFLLVLVLRILAAGFRWNLPRV